MKFTFLWRKQTKQFNSVEFYLEKLNRGKRGVEVEDSGEYRLIKEETTLEQRPQGNEETNPRQLSWEAHHRLREEEIQRP